MSICSKDMGANVPSPLLCSSVNGAKERLGGDTEGEGVLNSEESSGEDADNEWEDCRAMKVSDTAWRRGPTYSRLAVCGSVKSASERRRLRDVVCGWNWGCGISNAPVASLEVCVAGVTILVDMFVALEGITL